MRAASSPVKLVGCLADNSVGSWISGGVTRVLEGVVVSMIVSVVMVAHRPFNPSVTPPTMTQPLGERPPIPPSPLRLVEVADTSTHSASIAVWTNGTAHPPPACALVVRARSVRPQGATAHPPGGPFRLGRGVHAQIGWNRGRQTVRRAYIQSVASGRGQLPVSYTHLRAHE